MPFKGPIARGTIRTSAVLGVRLLVQAGTLLLVARLLGPHAYGAFAGVSSLAVILGTLSTFGMNLVLLGEMSRDTARRDHVMARAVPATLVCGVLLLMAFLAICRLGLREAEVPLRVLLAIGATETLLQPLFGLPASEQLAHGRTAYSQMLTTLPLALRLAATAGVALLAPSDPLTTFGYAYFAASVVALAIVSFVSPAPWPTPKEWRWPGKSEWREAAGYAALNVTAAGPAELDKTLATRLLPLADSGMYAAGQRVIGAATLPVVALLLSAMPRLFRESESQSQQTSRLLRWIFVATASYSITLSAGLWLCAPAIAWLFGHEYAALEHMLRWLILAVPGMALRVSAGLVLVALGKPWMRVLFEISGLLMLGIASFVLTDRYGILGMPLALACSESSMAIIGISIILRIQSSGVTKKTLDFNS